MIKIKVGDNVQISNRPVTPQDIKTGLFFTHYRGLLGTVQKVYAGGEVAVSIDPETLPEDVWLRHMSTRDRMRDAWIGGLSDEARRKLTPEQKRFELSYVVLVAPTDLERPKPARDKRAA
jgi:hypothetical protein